MSAQRTVVRDTINSTLYSIPSVPPTHDEPSIPPVHQNNSSEELEDKEAGNIADDKSGGHCQAAKDFRERDDPSQNVAQRHTCDCRKVSNDAYYHPARGPAPCSWYPE